VPDRHVYDIADFFGCSLAEAEAYNNRARWISPPESEPQTLIPVPGVFECRTLVHELLEDDRWGTGQNGVEIVQTWFVNYLEGVGR
jgi:hypothetical protein